MKSRMVISRGLGCIGLIHLDARQSNDSRRPFMGIAFDNRKIVSYDYYCCL